MITRIVFLMNQARLGKISHHKTNPRIDYALRNDQERNGQEKADRDREIEKKRKPKRSSEGQSLKS